jgi:peptide/nickel transport system substrate-binding protein
MKGDLDAARIALKATKYAGEKVVVINPTDYAPVRPLGQVTADMLKKLGMNVDLQETDWGTVVQRRYKKDSVENGGWSIFHTYGSASGMATPATSPFVRGLGETGFFGWWQNAKAEQLVQEWLDAPDEASQKRAITELGNLTIEQVATVPLGEFYLPMAYRRTLTGMLPGAAPYPWNVRPA